MEILQNCCFFKVLKTFSGEISCASAVLLPLSFLLPFGLLSTFPYVRTHTHTPVPEPDRGGRQVVPQGEEQGQLGGAGLEDDGGNPDHNCFK